MTRKGSTSYPNFSLEMGFNVMLLEDVAKMTLIMLPGESAFSWVYEIPLSLQVKSIRL